MKNVLPKLIGVIHLPPLVGAPGSSQKASTEIIKSAAKQAIQEAKALSNAGFEGIMIENFGDAPFYKSQVPAETIASMTAIIQQVRQATKLPLGVNILRNDAISALAVAAITDAQFIRVNVLSGVVATDQGLIEGVSAQLLRERARLNAEHISILADIQVKHGVTLSVKDPLVQMEENLGRGGASGIIVTGATTGRSPEFELLKNTASHASKHRVPLYIGSGMTPDGLRSLKIPKLGIIVGSSLRKSGIAGAALDAQQAQLFAKAYFEYSK